MRYPERAVRGQFWHRASAQRDPALDSLRDHPRFRAILQAQGGG